MDQPAGGTGKLRASAGEDDSMELSTCQELLHRLRELEVRGGRQGRAGHGESGLPTTELSVEKACQAGEGWTVGSLLKLPWEAPVPLHSPARATVKST